jgi:outer membrane protein OmpA-like peptidoglycan-associated protein
VSGAADSSAFELSGSGVLRDFAKLTTGVELLASGKWRFVRDFEAGVAVGPGLVGGVGTPAVRALASIAYTPLQEAEAKAKLEPAPVPVAPEPVPVVVAPEPADRDHDGVPDDADACPDAAGSVQAEPALNGCPHVVAAPAPEPPPRTISAVGEPLLFDLNSAQLSASSGKSLDDLAALMASHRGAVLHISGHSDDQGGDAQYNQKLSERRATAVRDALVSRGVPATRITTQGFGPSQPASAARDKAGHQANRRVQFTLEE